MGNFAITAQIIATVLGALLGLAAFLRSGKTEERAASQTEVNDLWDENRALRLELRSVRRDTQAEIAAVRQESLDRQMSLEAQHQRCEQELRHLRSLLT